MKSSSFVLIALLLSSKLVYWNTSGMEISLSLCLLVGTWYTWTKGQIKLAGFLCGLLMWTRIDNFFWVFVLIIVTLMANRKKAVELGIISVITYLPWVVFATIYFGSPVPQTITAKWVNYVQFNHIPISDHLAIIVKYLSPFWGGSPDSLQWAGVILVIEDQ